MLVCSLLCADCCVKRRDLKPANLMLTADYSQIKLADFGMSKKVNAHERSQATHKGHTGTVRYMAPEVCRGFLCVCVLARARANVFCVQQSASVAGSPA